MNDTRMNELVRMAMEAESLEREALMEGRPRLRLVGGDPPPVRRVRAWWVGAGVAAAACVAFVVALPAMLPHPAPLPDKPVVVKEEPKYQPAAPVIVQHQRLPIDQPKATPTPTVVATSDKPDIGSVERCVVMAIYRGDQGAMHCVQVKPHEWSNNKCLSEVTQQEMRCVPIARSCSSSADDALVVAMSGPQKSLPKSESEAVGVASCILGSPHCGSDGDARCFARAASECVPSDVSVRIESVPTGK
jgi:hypothetical protein